MNTDELLETARKKSEIESTVGMSLTRSAIIVCVGAGCASVNTGGALSVTLSGICKSLSMEQGQVSHFIAGMVTGPKPLVGQTPSATDRRVKFLSLTGAGVLELEKIKKAIAGPWRGEGGE